VRGVEMIVSDLRKRLAFVERDCAQGLSRRIVEYRFERAPITVVCIAGSVHLRPQHDLRTTCAPS